MHKFLGYIKYKKEKKKDGIHKYHENDTKSVKYQELGVYHGKVIKR